MSMKMSFVLFGMIGFVGICMNLHAGNMPPRPSQLMTNSRVNAPKPVQIFVQVTLAPNCLELVNDVKIDWEAAAVYINDANAYTSPIVSVELVSISNDGYAIEARPMYLPPSDPIRVNIDGSGEKFTITLDVVKNAQGFYYASGTLNCNPRPPRFAD